MSSANAAERERLHEPAEQVVDVGDCAVIGAPRGAHLSLGHRFGIHRANVAKAPRMRVERVPGRRHVDVLVAVEIPVALLHSERVMGMRKRSDQQERSLILCTREIEDRPLGHERRLIVEVELVRAHT